MNIDDPEPVLITRTFGGHVQFVLRNLTPRSVFANVIALLWIFLVSRFVRWFMRRRRLRPEPAT